MDIPSNTTSEIVSGSVASDTVYINAPGQNVGIAGPKRYDGVGNYPQPDFRLYVTPQNLARLTIVRNELMIDVPIDQCPSAWVRFWYRALLGWTWERIVPDETA